MGSRPRKTCRFPWEIIFQRTQRRRLPSGIYASTPWAGRAQVYWPPSLISLSSGNFRRLPSWRVCFSRAGNPSCSALWVAFVRSVNTQGKGKCESLSSVRLFVTLGTVARQAPGPLDSPGESTGVGSHSLLQGIFQTRIEFRPPALQADSLPFEPPGKPVNTPNWLQTGVCAAFSYKSVRSS